MADNEPHKPSSSNPPEGLMLRHVLPKLDKWWFQHGHLRSLNLLLLAGLLTQATTGYDGSMLNGLQALPSWADYFDKPTGIRLGAMVNGTVFGTLVAMLVSAWICDKLGRRWPIFGGSCTILVGTILQASSQNFGSFIASRWIIGFGLGVLQVCSTLFLSEVSYPAHRGKITAIYEPAWPLGALIAAWITFGSFKMHGNWAWRLPSLLQGVTSLIQACLVFFAPESPRWLISKGRHGEAFEMLTKYYGGGDRTSALVMFEIVEINVSLEVDKANKAVSWLAFFSTSGNRRRFYIVATAGFCLQWAGNSIVSYFLPLVLTNSGVTDSYTQLVINACTQVWSFLWAVFFGLTIDRVGRRKLLLSSYIAMFLTYLVWTILAAIATRHHFENKYMGHGIIVLIFAFFCFYHMAAPVMPAYCVEILTFELRAKGMTIFQLGSTLASIFNGFTNPIALENLGWKYYIVFLCLLAFWTLVIWVGYPETKGLSLEEMTTIFDGEHSTLKHGVSASLESNGKSGVLFQMEHAEV
ncbi:hexose transporter protein [Metarhizium guizhouense ARSEF 977]|uniref:Hexose transporter protein n=1 Tax=Metarhizium guizhouense (strain ARSEF 977) TaxID=1276136 RepID=A0A0B4HWY5_METGA|nr:hexose transporter protein [Metarhizium guizhouense ARSEF 977]